MLFAGICHAENDWIRYPVATPKSRRGSEAESLVNSRKLINDFRYICLVGYDELPLSARGPSYSVLDNRKVRELWHKAAAGSMIPMRSPVKSRM
jgi:hypothetical protein